MGIREKLDQRSLQAIAVCKYSTGHDINACGGRAADSGRRSKGRMSNLRTHQFVIFYDGLYQFYEAGQCATIALNWEHLTGNSWKSVSVVFDSSSVYVLIALAVAIHQITVVFLHGRPQ